MTAPSAAILVINAGSSSVRFAVHQAGAPLQALLYGKLDRIGAAGSTLSWHTTEGRTGNGRVEVPDLDQATSLLVEWLEAREEFAAVRGIGHRVVHGDGMQWEAERPLRCPTIHLNSRSTA